MLTTLWSLVNTLLSGQYLTIPVSLFIVLDGIKENSELVRRLLESIYNFKKSNGHGTQELC